MLIGGNGEVVLLTLNRNGSVSEMKLLATSSDHLFAGLDISEYCSVLQCVVVCCSVLQCVVVCCSVLQCVALCCIVL